MEFSNDTYNIKIRRRPRVFPILLGVLGLALLGGGVQLLSLGGSSWYALTGAVILVSALLLWRGSRWGAWLYGAMLFYTLIWALAEVGLDGWALMPRLLPLAVLGLAFLTTWLQRGIDRGPPPLLCRFGITHRHTTAAVWVLITCAVVTLAATLAGESSYQPPEAIAHPATALGSQGTDWPNYANDTAGSHFSSLTQLTPQNVGKLKLAWVFRTGEPQMIGKLTAFNTTPLKIGDDVFICTSRGTAYAVDAETGKLRWKFDPKVDMTKAYASFCRGMSHYHDSQTTGPCRDRIYYGTPDAKLWSLDALSGRPCETFGKKGALDLLEGLGSADPFTYMPTQPPLIAGDTLVAGSAIRDNYALDMPSGVVRAFDPVTGKLKWAWDMGQPDRHDAPPPGETYTRSTANAWANLSFDDKLGLVYVPVANPAVDHWGGRRRPFDERYGSSLVALDVHTGVPRWSFQTTHHDVWDWDLPAQPVLIDIPTASGITPAVVQPTKRGELFVLDRRDGRPIFPVTEVRVPVTTSTLAGEWVAPTQPVSALSVMPPPLKEADMWGATPLDQMWCRIRFRQADYNGPYQLPEQKLTLHFPGHQGILSVGSVSLDPERKLLFVNSSVVPYLMRMLSADQIPSGSGAREVGEGFGLQIPEGAPYAANFSPFLNPLQIPCTRPPWGKLRAIDLRTGKTLWQQPVGTMRDTGPLGVATQIPLTVGTPQTGGSLVTRSGLIFAAGTIDNYLRARDIRTGRVLWEARLPAGGQATPVTYVSRLSGRQFVVMPAGGHGLLRTQYGDYLLGYALP